MGVTWALSSAGSVDLQELVQEVGRINAKLTGLIHNLQGVVANALRKDRGERRRKDPVRLTLRIISLHRASPARGSACQ
jgi:hypothetical protein